MTRTLPVIGIVGGIGSGKSVVAADEFGTIVDKNPGEFLKWLPGVDVEYFANNIIGVSVRAMALMYVRLVAPPENFDEETRRACQRIVAAMTRYPAVQDASLPKPSPASNPLTRNSAPAVEASMPSR